MSKQIPRQQSQAERLMAMGQMAASLAHEIRNPLGSMELFCSLLKKDLRGQPQLLQAAEQIHLGIRTLDRIISNCLQFAKDISPKRKLCGDVAPILDEVLTYVRTKAEDRGVKLNVEKIGEGEIEVDQYLVHQVLVNLMINAVDAASERIGAGVVTLRSAVSPDRWEVAIEDNGFGIPEAELRNIFDPFFTTKQGGTGLGLAIVHSIVTAHDGDIRIESRAGEGTTATVTFPRRARQDEKPELFHNAAQTAATGG